MTTTIGPVTPAERESVSNLLPRTAAFAVPAGTRSIRVTITATRAQGDYNDGYVDNVSLSLAGPPVAGQSVGAKVVSGTVLVRVGGQFVPLTPSLLRNGAEIDARRGVVEITRADGGVAKFYDGIFKLSQSGGITTLTLSEALDCSRRGRAAGGGGAEEAQDAAAVGRRQGQVPHEGALRGRDGARDQVARDRHLHDDHDPGHAGRRDRARHGAQAHRGRAQGRPLRRPARLTRAVAAAARRRRPRRGRPRRRVVEQHGDDLERAVDAVGHLGVDVGRLARA